MLDGPCRCGHPRHLHADHDNPLQVVPVAMTEVDAGNEPDVSVLVRGAGHCTVPGCDCTQFRDAEP